MHTPALALVHHEPRFSLAGRRVCKHRPTAVRPVVPVRFHGRVRAKPDKHLNSKQLVAVYDAVALQYFAVVVRKVQAESTSKLEAHRREEGWPLVAENEERRFRGKPE